MLLLNKRDQTWESVSMLRPLMLPELGSNRTPSLILTPHLYLGASLWKALKEREKKHKTYTQRTLEHYHAQSEGKRTSPRTGWTSRQGKVAYIILWRAFYKFNLPRQGSCLCPLLILFTLVILQFFHWLQWQHYSWTVSRIGLFTKQIIRISRFVVIWAPNKQPVFL